MASDSLHFKIAQLSDFDDVIALLKSADLPVDDLNVEHLRYFLTTRENGKLTGVGGLEIYNDAALLRSVAVAESQRNRGIAHQLLAALEKLARENGVSALYLLTTTADKFFAKHGFAVIDRESVPKRIRETREFASICPSSAICMKKSIE